MDSALASSSLFRDVPENILRVIEDESDKLKLPAGEVLFRQGDLSDAMFVVLHGRLEVVVTRKTAERVVMTRIGKGACVGEMGLLTREVRSATVRAVRDSELVRLSTRAFDQLLDRHPRAATELARVLVDRLRDTTQRPPQPAPVATIALVPIDGGLPAGFASAFVDALSRVTGSALHVDRSRADLALGGRLTAMLSDPAQSTPLCGWMDEQEARSKLVIFETEPTGSPWTDICVRQADLILLVASAESDPNPGPIEHHLARITAIQSTPAELVLLHPPETALPAGTSAWTATRRLTRHHHVRKNRVDDYSRLARSVTGRAVGVVFGGGGARAYLHAGVIRALREKGIPIDLVGGTSMGAIAAALCALERTGEQIVEFGTTGYGANLGTNLIRDTTLPIASFLSGRRTVKMLRDSFGETRIEDLWLPFYCVSASLTSARVVVHEDGPVWLAIRASLSIPGILPPVVLNGEMLVDGGLLDNLPVTTMRSRAGTVIAIDIASGGEMAGAPSSSTMSSGWSQLAARCNPFARRPSLPHIFSVLTRATGLPSAHDVEALKQQADLYLHPTAEGISLFDWKAGKKLMDVGYRYALAELDKWKADAALTSRVLGGVSSR